MYRQLNVKEEADFRRWARDNHQMGDTVNSMWHPVVIDEITKMEKEWAEKI